LGYSKRWYLLHLLGGKCFDCGNENFYELEIDHIFDDGDGERKYYTKTETHYLNNPNRARQRLQLLCKKCHEKKHIILPDSWVFPQSDPHRKLKIFMGVLQELEGITILPVQEVKLVQTLVRNENFTENEARNFIRRMLREASIYESKIGCYNSV